MSLFSEFKEFASKGSVVDLAVGVIIGNAFGKIVSSMTDKILMPPVGYLVGGVDFSKLRLVLQLPGIAGRDEVSIGYGDFIQAGVNFIIIAWAMFLLIKLMNKLKLSTPAAPPEQTLLLREIRDLLKQNDNK